MAEQQNSDPELQALLNNNNTDVSLKLSKFTIPNSTKELYCNITKERVRPYVPKKCREAVMQKLHSLSHPGMKATKQLIANHYVWPSMYRDVAAYVRACIPCQRAKIQRHTRSPLGEYVASDCRFEHINIDIIGPLPSSNGFRYCLTCIDRFSRWPTAVPIIDITAHSVAHALISGWIAIYGVPLRITTDLGRQFESSVFKELTRLLGVKHLKTTAYHPQANGIIERWHRTLKCAIKCIETDNWSAALPLILLGMRCTIKSDIGLSPADMVFGSALRIPGAFLVPTKINANETEFVQTLRKAISQLPTTKPVRHGTEQSFVQPALNDCKYVFVRVDHVRTPLEPSYEGPYEVMAKRDKYFVIKTKQRDAKISIDRLKAAYIFSPKCAPFEAHPVVNESSPADVENVGADPVSDEAVPVAENLLPTTSQNTTVQKPRQTSSGRRVVIPFRYR